MFAFSANAALLQMDFGTSYGDPFDTDTAAPDGPAPWMTAVFDDGDIAGSVTLTLTVAGTVGDATVSAVYFNLVDDSISLGIVESGGTGPLANGITSGSNIASADGSGLYDIYIDLPPPDTSPGPGTDYFEAGETLVYTITGAGITVDSFNAWSEDIDTTGPFIASAKFQSTGTGVQSDWVGVVPIPAAVWLFGSALGALGWMRRKVAV